MGSATAGAVALRFGNCNNGANDGLRALNLNNTATNANWNIGAAFIYLITEDKQKCRSRSYTADG